MLISVAILLSSSLGIVSAIILSTSCTGSLAAAAGTVPSCAFGESPLARPERLQTHGTARHQGAEVSGGLVRQGAAPPRRSGRSSPRQGGLGQPARRAGEGAALARRRPRCTEPLGGARSHPSIGGWP